MNVTFGNSVVSGTTMSNSSDSAQETTQLTLKQAAKTAGCGLMMGAADIIPGVSGGTVALILGIYHRLVNAISHIDRAFVKLVVARRWTDAIAHADLKFVTALGTGILTGVGGLAILMHHLLEHHAQLTNAVFFGLIMGSGVIVAKSIEKWSTSRFVNIGCGIALSAWLVGLSALQNPPAELWYLFFCGSVGICAMILPGISGAFILLILGRYEHVTGLLRGLLKGDWSGSNILAVAVFGTGCIVGLLAFSRVLRRLLANHSEATLACLCGFMLGSLRKIWPFKEEMTREQAKSKLGNIWPEALDTMTISTIALAIAALIAVLVLERISNSKPAQPET
jgi:putative membrane protein